MQDGSMLPFRAVASSRRELKYLIHEETARKVRDFVRPYLKADEYSQSPSSPGYPVHSVYLDSEQLALYRSTVDGKKNRFKLRVRCYDFAPQSPVFLEVKRRVNDVVLKSRAPVSRSAAESFLQGARLRASDLLAQNAKNEAGLNHFCELCDRLQAKGTAFVTYRREAYVHPVAPGLRVTIDRDLAGSPFHAAHGLALPAELRRARLPGVILELKYADRFPDWMLRLVQAFSLQNQSVPKYVECVDLYRGDWIHPSLAAGLAS
jgi:hypothetical protein